MVGADVLLEHGAPTQTGQLVRLLDHADHVRVRPQERPPPRRACLLDPDPDEIRRADRPALRHLGVRWTRPVARSAPGRGSAALPRSGARSQDPPGAPAQGLDHGRSATSDRDAWGRARTMAAVCHARPLGRLSDRPRSDRPSTAQRNEAKRLPMTEATAWPPDATVTRPRCIRPRTGRVTRPNAPPSAWSSVSPALAARR